jgi:hypothetical protein
MYVNSIFGYKTIADESRYIINELELLVAFYAIRVLRSTLMKLLSTSILIVQFLSDQQVQWDTIKNPLRPCSCCYRLVRILNIKLTAFH